jgi:hypothetical protein
MYKNYELPELEQFKYQGTESMKKILNDGELLQLLPEKTVEATAAATFKKKLFQASIRLWLNNTKTGKNYPLLNVDLTKKKLCMITNS